MKKLTRDWFTEGLIDFEYKQYLLLAYLAEIKKLFSREMLYPALSELIYHYENLVRYQKLKQDLAEKFPQHITDFNLRNLTIQYQSDFQEGEIFKEIDDIVAYSISQIQSHVQVGKAIYDTVEEKLSVGAVGLIPIYKYEGYLFVRNGKTSYTDIYQYSISVISYGEERTHGIHTQYIQSCKLGLANTYEHIKLRLIRQHRELPNPATYVVELGKKFPLKETVIPIVKRKLLSLVLKNK